MARARARRSPRMIVAARYWLFGLSGSRLVIAGRRIQERADAQESRPAYLRGSILVDQAARTAVSTYHNAVVSNSSGCSVSRLRSLPLASVSPCAGAAPLPLAGTPACPNDPTSATAPPPMFTELE